MTVTSSDDNRGASGRIPGASGGGENPANVLGKKAIMLAVEVAFSSSRSMKKRRHVERKSPLATSERKSPVSKFLYNSGNHHMCVYGMPSWYWSR